MPFNNVNIVTAKFYITDGAKGFIITDFLCETSNIVLGVAYNHWMNTSKPV